jgi:hypothetical protein
MCTIIKDKTKIQEAIENESNGKLAKLRGEKHPELEEALFKWLKNIQSENIAVDAPTLKVNFDFKNFIV